MSIYKASTTFTETDITTLINFSSISVYANNADAITGGLVSGNLYRTASGDMKTVV